MPSCKHYTPVLKAKQGELSALNALDEATWSRITPLLEVTGQPYDYVSDRYAKTLEVHLGEVSGRISAAVKPGQSFFIDVPEGTDAEASGSRLLDGAAQRFLAGLRTKGLNPIGVTGLDRPDTYHRAIAAAGGGEFCIRAPLDQFGRDETDAWQVVDRVCGVLGAGRAAVHMVIDLGAIGDSPNIGRSQWRMLVRGAIAELSGGVGFASLTLVASSFPKDLSDMDAASEREIPRDEWMLWQSLVSGRENDPDAPRFGDYAVSHPQVLEMDPRFMRMSANIRYSTEYNWLLVKGRNVRDHGYEQFNDLSRLLVANQAFKGPDFSWGDKYIAACAADKEGPGNATTWRKVGTNHHITLVADQLSRMAGS